MRPTPIRHSIARKGRRKGGPTIQRSAVIALALGLAACGGSYFTSSTPDPSLLDPSQPRSPKAEVDVKSTGFDPQVLHVDAPVTVTFVNEDSVPHTLQSAPNLGWDDCPEMRTVGTLQPSQRLAVAFSESDAVCAYDDAARASVTAFQGYIAIHPSS